MNLPPLVPPLKCQGIKTKLVGEIYRIAQAQAFERWVEPFCGSGVVALNLQPKAALLADAACRGAVYNVRINISSLDDRSLGQGLIEEASQLLAQTRAFVDHATSAVERAIG